MSGGKQLRSVLAVAAGKAAWPAWQKLRSRRLGALLSVPALLAAMASHAQEANWTGATSNDWFDGSNWDTGVVPASFVDVVIDSLSGSAPVIQAPGAEGTNLSIGETGLGYLTISRNGTLSNVMTTLGNSEGSRGTAELSGIGVNWTVSDLLAVGYEGTGRLSIKGGATVNARWANIGMAADAGSKATVTGPGSQWVNTESLFVGAAPLISFSGVAGAGELEILNGGEVIDVNGVIGRIAGSRGTVTVSGVDSAWSNSGILYVGFEGAGALAVEGGGTVTSDTAAIGQGVDGEGAVTVSGAGSRWINGNYLFVGEFGKGGLTISNGGKVTNQMSAVGREEGSEGAVRVAGAGSTWTSNGFFLVGDQGRGELTVADAGEVISNSQVRIGEDPTSVGTARVSGTGSLWRNSGQFAVGFWGRGALLIENGGIVSGASYTSIATWDDSQGEVAVTGPGSAWHNAGELHVGRRGGGALFIENGAFVGSGPGSIGTGAGSEGIVTLAGAGSGWMVGGDLVVGHEGMGSMTIGSGASVSAGGTVTVADQPGSRGLLLINGLLTGGRVDIGPAGRLGGGGIVRGDTAVAGTVAPGQSIGTLTVDGNYTQRRGSIYALELDGAGNSDWIKVSGTASIEGGAVDITPRGGYVLGSGYTILSAAGGVSGAFDETSIAASFAFLSPELSYDSNNVFLTLTESTPLPSVARTRNQIATAEGIDSMAHGTQIRDALIVLDADSARAAFDALSGEIHASAKSALLEDSHFLRNAVHDRLRMASGAVGAWANRGGAFDQASGMEVGGSGDPAFSASTSGRYAAWGRPFGSWGGFDGDGNAASLDTSTRGVFLGADGAVSEHWRLGVLAGYGHTSFDAGGRSSSGSSDSYHLGLYGGTQWGALRLSAGLAHSWHEIDTRRSASFPGFSDSLRGKYHARTFQVFSELGYRIDAGAGSVEPFFNLAHVNLRTDSFTEEGGPAALSGSGETTKTTYSTVGLRASARLDPGASRATLRGLLGWRRAFGDAGPLSRHALAGSDAFTIAGVPIARNAAVVQAGLDLEVADRATLGLSYAGQFGSGARQHGALAHLSMPF